MTSPDKKTKTSFKTDSTFLEVEHKFLAKQDFNRNEFRAQVKQLNPTEIFHIQVQDTYFILPQSGVQQIFRHRFDERGEQLTVKTVVGGNEVRKEVNLQLLHTNKSQFTSVKEFLEMMGCQWNGVIAKDLEVYNFNNCEICHYIARSETSSSKKVKKQSCIEFEAKNFTDVPQALEILTSYENKLGFDPKNRELRSIFELMFWEEVQSLGFV